MTHTPIHHLAVGILAIAVAGVIWLALSTTTVPGVGQDVQLQLRGFDGPAVAAAPVGGANAVERSRPADAPRLATPWSGRRPGEPPARPSLRGSAKAIAAPAAASTPSAAGRDKRSE